MQRAARITAFITGAAWLGFGLWLFLDPAALPRVFGVGEVPAAFLAELRAFYGGVELAIGAGILLLLQAGELRSALLIGGLTLAGACVGRFAGVMLDGPAPIHFVLGASEAVGAVANLALMARLLQSPDRDAIEPPRDDA